MSNKNVFKVRATVIAVHATLAWMAMHSVAFAQESVAELMTPSSSVSVGVVGADKASYKFGEYNGLQKNTPQSNIDFQINGGQPEKALRYTIVGENLGLDTRNLRADYGVQGLFRLNFEYDEIQYNRSDSYQTPYLGSGTDTLTLPSNWATNSTNCAISSTSKGNTNLGGASNASAGAVGCGNYYVNQNTGNTSATAVGNAGALTASELGDFQKVTLQTKRAKTKVGFQMEMGREWTFSTDARHEEKNGSQAIGQPIAGAAANAVIVANPINYVTNELDLKLAYAGEKSFAELAYSLSFFDDQYKSLTYQDPWFSSKTPTVPTSGPNTFPFPDWGRMATAPSNQMHLLSLNGGYKFSPTTKLVGWATYGKNTQTESYLPVGTGTQNSTYSALSNLGGEVDINSYGMKLTGRPIKSVTLGAGYKYDERINNSSVGSYTFPFNPQDGQIAASNTTFKYNLAYSRKVSQTNLDADWGFSPGQALKAGLEQQDSKRWCNNLPSTVASCVNASTASELTTRLDYRNTMFETVTGRIGVASGLRTASAYGANVALYAGDLLTRFSMTDRQRDKLRSSVTWQPSETLDVTLGYETNNDKYTLGRNPNGNLNLGVDSTNSQTLNLDVTYRMSDRWVVNGFYTDETSSSKLNGNAATSASAVATANTAVPGGAYWWADLKDTTTTYGLNLQANGYMSGALDLGVGYLKSESKSPYGISVGSYLAYSASATSGVAQSMAKSAIPGYPDTYANSETVTLTAKYKVSKATAIKVSFQHEKLASADPAYYNGMQVGAATGVVSGSGTAKVNGTALTATQVLPFSTLLPSNEQAPNYDVNALGVTFVFTF